MSNRSKKSKGTEKKRDKYGLQSLPIVPHVYPLMPGLPGFSIPSVSPTQWGHPSFHPNFQYPWFNPSWVKSEKFPETKSWAPSPAVTTTSKEIVPGPDEYMVNTLSRIYNDEDGSIAIERVKFQRMSGNFDTKLCPIEYPESGHESLNPHGTSSAISASQNVKKPPPRKNKKKRKAPEARSEGMQQEQAAADVPQSWFPIVPYMPQPYPYLYPYNYMWASPVPSAFDYHSHTDESDSSVSRQEGILSSPGTPASQKLDSKDTTTTHQSLSPDFARAASSSAGASQVTDSQATDIAPSDSVSVRGFKRKTSIEKMLSSVRTTEKSSDKTKDSDERKTKEWMRNMKKVLVSSADEQSDITPDRSSFVTATSDIPTPPQRNKKQKPPIYVSHKKSSSESNIRVQENSRNTGSTSPPLLSNTRVSDTDLIYAFKKLDRTIDILKLKNNTVVQEPTKAVTQDPIQAPVTITEPERVTEGVKRETIAGGADGGRHSRASTTSYHSTRQSADDQEPVDTDSTDIALPTDTQTADESTEHLESETSSSCYVDINYKWILQDTDEGLTMTDEKRNNEDPHVKETWKAEVSLWRARLVVSLCQGQGLDQQEWNTFQLLIQHPLSLDSKLSLLHAHRLCSLNCDLGVVFLRNALLLLTTYGETLLKPEKERPPGWKYIRLDGNQLWSPVKGSIEILYVLGYRLRDKGILQYQKNNSPETSVIARITLDILVLAEEMRLYLTGSHPCAMNITQLFVSICSSPVAAHSIVSANRTFTAETQEADPPEHTVSIDETTVEKENVSVEKDRTAVETGTQKISHSLSQEDKKSSEMVESKEMSQITLSENKLSESMESLTPVASPDITEFQDERKTLDLINDSVHIAPKGSEDLNRKGLPNNPEEHIYEEIKDVKGQGVILKEKNGQRSKKPPPLPPKARMINGSSELRTADNLYPHVEWSTGSQCSSVQSGSTASRKKKRRAPMPPSFMRNIATSEDNKENLGSRTAGPNPFYEELSNATTVEKETTKETNPFYHKHERPSGHVGKNPFYEDVEKRHVVSQLKTDTPSDKSKIFAIPEVLKSVSSEYTISDTDTDKKTEGNDSESSEKVIGEEVSNYVEGSAHSEKIKINSDSIDTVTHSGTSNYCDDKASRNGPVPSVEICDSQNSSTDASLSVVGQLHSNKTSESSSQTSSVITVKSSPNLKCDDSTVSLISQEEKGSSANSVPKNMIDSKKTDGEHQTGSQVAVPIKKIDSKGANLKKEPKKADVIIKEIIISYDISLNEPSVKHTEQKKSSQDLKTASAAAAKNKNQIEEISKALPMKSLLDTIEFIDSDDISEPPPILPPKATLRLLDDIPYIEKKLSREDLRLSAVKDDLDSPPERPPPPPPPPLDSPPRTPTSSSTDLSKLLKSSIRRSDHALPTGGSKVPPETPHTSPPSSPVQFLHSQIEDADSVPFTDGSAELSATSREMPDVREKQEGITNLEEIPTNKTSEIHIVKNASDEDRQADLTTHNKASDLEQSSENKETSAVVEGELDTDQQHPDKEQVLFERSADQKVCASSSVGRDENENIKKESKDTFEERYEIPDVLIAEAHAKTAKMKVFSPVRAVAKILKKDPVRPPRHCYIHKAPPLPPKKQAQDAAPALPPKGASLSSIQLSLASPFTHGSEKSKSVGSLNEGRPRNAHAISPSPLAIPSVSPEAYVAPSVHPTSTRVTYIHDPTSSKALATQHPVGAAHLQQQQSSKPPKQHSLFSTKSVSMPSSPKTSRAGRLRIDSKTKKEHRSWPFQLCNCINANDSPGDDGVKVKYIMT